MAAASASSSKNNLADDPSAWDCFNMWTFLFEEEYDAKLKLEQSMASSLPTAGFHVRDITELEFSPYGRDCEFTNELQIEESDYIKARDTLIAVLLAAAESLWTEEGSQVAEICLQTSEKFVPVTDLSCFRKNSSWILSFLRHDQLPCSFYQIKKDYLSFRTCEYDLKKTSSIE